jgi:hypothetical protein
VAGDLQNFDPLKFVTDFDSLQEHDVSLVCGLFIFGVHGVLRVKETRNYLVRLNQI